MIDSIVQLLKTRIHLQSTYRCNALLIGLMILLSSTTSGAPALKIEHLPPASANQTKETVIDETDANNQKAPRQHWQSSQNIKSKPAAKATSKPYPKMFASTGSQTQVKNPSDIPPPVAQPEKQPEAKPVLKNNDDPDLPKIKIQMLSPAGYPSAEVTLPEKPTDYKKDIEHNIYVH